jgi:hypothetical protein
VFLLPLYLEYILLPYYDFKGTAGDIFILTRFDGSMFNLARLRAKTKTKECLNRELLFADNAAIVAHNESTLQSLINELNSACDLFSLKINIKKTVVLGQVQSENNISIKKTYVWSQ